MFTFVIKIVNFEVFEILLKLFFEKYSNIMFIYGLFLDFCFLEFFGRFYILEMNSLFKDKGYLNLRNIIIEN